MGLEEQDDPPLDEDAEEDEVLPSGLSVRYCSERAAVEDVDDTPPGDPPLLTLPEVVSSIVLSTDALRLIRFGGGESSLRQELAELFNCSVTSEPSF